MIDVLIAEPGELSHDDLRSAEALVRAAFGDGFRPHDWLHGVEGVHVRITEDHELLAHAAVVPRTLRHMDDVFDTGYVEAVAVRGDQQGRGLGRRLMEHTETVIRARHDIGALNAVESAAAFYAGRGWRPWDGPTRADTPEGLIDTYDPTDRIFLFPTDRRALGFTVSAPLICDWRVGDLW
ncbi:GNAT family N-acetyltransferase [Mycolicibacterium neworleansense]|uniref:Aminoglycoside 2'-N-acetyltransferase Aac n=1 Tax=Mycolicibacterium neworleansense TaxID=146018 RepID=A0A0H5RYV8_9MYCO|nr:GNAT family N-acetyltransferase [Mycolicibacterium neworleansense]MCV7362640.1 GNAT family N-acetyltransferase [Mycolicibacterium neworleansense]CRZ18727.1 aminoglycoside 2'-N-acetyltransferase Aac [Mycolicibacterium neworleansense]